MMTLPSPQPAIEKNLAIHEKTFHSKVSPWLRAIAYPLLRRIILPLYFRNIEVYGQENIPLDGPVILAPTHRSRWDAIMVPFATGRHVTGRDLRFLVTVDEVKGFQGWGIRNLGGFPVDPRRPAIASLRYVVEILLNREMLVIFPEGNIFQDGELHPLKPGLARMAIQAESFQENLGVKILPMTIHYSPNIPRWRGKVKIIIGKPLSVAEYTEGSIKQQAKKLTEDLTEALQAIHL
jgi:1-acyl-sn-glycerol-3-phosphate acyltransferase